MRAKFYVGGSLLAASVAQAVTQVPAQAQTPTMWRLATGYRAEMFNSRNLMQFAPEVDKATGGQLRTEVVPNNALVKLTEIPQAVMGGRVEASEAIMVGMDKDFPLAGAADDVLFVVGSPASASNCGDRAEICGFALSQQAAQGATDELRRNAIKVDALAFKLTRDLKRMGEKCSREWIGQIGHRANMIFFISTD